MVFCILHGSGQKFGPYFLSEGRVTQYTYRELLKTKVFPKMKEKLSLAGFKRTIWNKMMQSPTRQ